MPAAPIVFGREFFEVDPRSTALIVIDMQNAFVAEGATYERLRHAPCCPIWNASLILRVNRACRSFGLNRTIVLPLGASAQIFPTTGKTKILEGPTSFELYEQMLQPKEGEYRVVKHKYDAFFETDLHSILRNNRIKTIIIVGTATNVCCEFTARSGFFRDYQVAFPSDCNASFDEGMHQASLKTIDMFFGRVMTSEELLDEMRNELGWNDRVAAE